MASKPINYSPRIEKKIPIPVGVIETKRWKILAEQMHPGDSVFVRTESHRVNMRTALVRAGKKCMSLKEKDGFRVWARE